MNFHVYILYSEIIDRFYIGHTGNTLRERLRKHNSNHKEFTHRANDWILMYKESYPTKNAAYFRELEIKRKKSRKYIESLIKKI